jgi:hypothetical protein
VDFIRFDILGLEASRQFYFIRARHKHLVWLSKYALVVMPCLGVTSTGFANSTHSKILYLMNAPHFLTFGRKTLKRELAEGNRPGQRNSL